MVSWAHTSSQLKQHHDRFSCFCRAHYCDRQTHHTTWSVTVVRICVHSTAMRPKNVADCYVWVLFHLIPKTSKCMLIDLVFYKIYIVKSVFIYRRLLIGCSCQCAYWLTFILVSSVVFCSLLFLCLILYSVNYNLFLLLF